MAVAHFSLVWRPSSLRLRVRRINCFWSQTWKHCIRTCASGPSKGSSKVDFTCLPSSSTRVQERGRRSCDSLAFIPRTATTGPCTSAAELLRHIQEEKTHDKDTPTL